MGRTFILVFCLNLCLYLLDAHPALDPTIQQFQNGDNAYEDIEKNDEEFDLPKINLDHGYPDENDDYDLSSSNENDYNFEYNGHSSVEEDKTIHKDVKRENSGFFNETDSFDGGEEVVAKDEETSTVSTNETDHSKPEEVEVEPVGEIITTEGNEEDELIGEPTNIEEEDLPQNNETIFQRSLENMPTHEDLTEDSSDDNEHISYFPPDVPPGPFAPHTRIVGGNKVTNREKFAYQASLRYVSNSHFCGATIIDETNLLTAAHCVYDDNHRLLPATRLLIVVGDLHVKEPTVDTMVRVVQHIFPHPNYNYKTFKNDIAVLRVESMGNFTEYINKVELAAQTPAVGTDCVVSGWGKTSFKGTASLQLMEVTVPILSTDTCMKGYGNAILEGMLCAGSMQGGKDACQGDSGGPLVCNNQLAGVVSWGYDCALKNYPGVYTDVAEYYTWIREQQGPGFNDGLELVTEPVVEARKSEFIAEKRENFPYQASLRYTALNTHFCGATIIDSTHLITAANCVMDKDEVIDPTNLMVVVGDLNILEETDSTEYRVLVDIFTHPDYNSTTFENDIAVIRISETFGDWTQDIKPIEIAENSPPAYSTCVVSGWGSVNSPNSSSEVLRFASLPIIEERTCSEYYGDAVKSGMFCAGFIQKGKDSCQGDSGGPLVCDNKLSGIVSWGRKCSNEGVPGVYTDATMYRTWIEEQKARSNTSIVEMNFYLIFLSYFVLKLI